MGPGSAGFGTPEAPAVFCLCEGFCRVLQGANGDTMGFGVYESGFGAWGVEPHCKPFRRSRHDAQSNCNCQHRQSRQQESTANVITRGIAV